MIQRLFLKTSSNYTPNILVVAPLHTFMSMGNDKQISLSKVDTEESLSAFPSSNPNLSLSASQTEVEYVAPKENGVDDVRE